MAADLCGGKGNLDTARWRPGNPIRVLVADDSAFMRKAISSMLAKGPDIEVVGTANNGIQAIE